MLKFIVLLQSKKYHTSISLRNRRSQWYKGTSKNAEEKETKKDLDSIRIH